MAKWIDVATLGEIAPGTWKVIDYEEHEIMIINKDGEYFAIEDICTHDEGILSDGELENDEVICPRHGARFCIRTGEVTEPPAYEDIDTFPVRIENDRIQIEVEE